MHSDWYELWRHYWWLIFPLFWMIAAMAAQWSRHARANRALDIVKTYVDQGKEPPAELLAFLQCPGRPDWEGGWRDRGWRYGPHRYWRRTFLFAALAAVFAGMAFWPDGELHYGHHGMFGMVFVAAILGALALANLASALFDRPSAPPGKDRTP